MTAFTEKPPQPLPPNVRRYDEKGRPTPDQVSYEKKLFDYLVRLIANLT
jgi:hypothetical protein